MTNVNNNQPQVTEQDMATIEGIMVAMANMTPQGREMFGQIMTGAQQKINNMNGDVNMNNQETVSISRAKFEELTQEIATLKAQVAGQATVQQPQANTGRVVELEAELTAIQQRINNNNTYGLQTPQVTIDKYNKLYAEYQSLMGVGIKATVVDTIDKIGAFGQNKIAADFIPNTINNTTGFLADLINVASEIMSGFGDVLTTAIEGVGNVATVTTNTVTGIASDTLGLGANAVSQVGKVTGVAAQNAVHTTFNVIRK